MQTLSLIDLRGVQKPKEKIEIKIPAKIKTSGHNGKQLVFLTPFCSDENICPVSALMTYIQRIKDLLGGTQTLFISFQRPHKEVC